MCTYDSSDQYVTSYSRGYTIILGVDFNSPLNYVFLGLYANNKEISLSHRVWHNLGPSGGCGSLGRAPVGRGGAPATSGQKRAGHLQGADLILKTFWGFYKISNPKL